MVSKDIRIVLVDDHAVVRESVAAMLDQVPGMTVVGEASTVESALDVITSAKPDVVLLDLWLNLGPREGGEPDGIRVLRTAREEGSEARFVIFTGDVSRHLLAMALSAGAGGFVSKMSSAVEVIHAVEAASSDRVPVIATFSERLTPRELPAVTEDDPLSPRELEVLTLVARGLSSKEAAEQLQISPATVDTYRRRIATKLGSRSRAAIVSYALSHGLLD